MNTYDAIVIGAGPAGSTAALLLARAGWSVALVEKSAFPRRKVCGEFISAPALTLLERAGLARDVIEAAGPEVREVAIYAGERMVTGEMPPAHEAVRYGCALGRETLDALLLSAASRAGASVWQPWRVARWSHDGARYACVMRKAGGEARELRAPVLIAAHGSWDRGRLPLPGVREDARPSDLLAFKAHFRAARLPAARMPLVAFPGGYGGLVRTDGGRVSFSCCIRRDRLATCRREAPGASAGSAVLAHVFGASRGVREALDQAVREGAWLAAGPLKPGIRRACGAGYFALGNVQGEAHPIVAEGISMAIQSAWLLCERLIAAGPRAGAHASSPVAHDYESAYRANFEQRVRAASAFAQLAMRPAAALAVTALLDALPGVLALGARWAGKAQALRAS